MFLEGSCNLRCLHKLQQMETSCKFGTGRCLCSWHHWHAIWVVAVLCLCRAELSGLCFLCLCRPSSRRMSLRRCRRKALQLQPPLRTSITKDRRTASEQLCRWPSLCAVIGHDHGFAFWMAFLM